MARQVRPALPEPGYHKDHREVVKVLRRKSADSIMAQRAVSLQERRRIYACSRPPDGHQQTLRLQSGVGPYMHAVVPLTAISKHYPCKAGWVHICDKRIELDITAGFFGLADPV